jgi:DNA-binding transcriptional LysR family regulator
MSDEPGNRSACHRPGSMPASTATDAVKQLEARLGVRLLQRTTRQVRPTLDGEAYYRRCLTILDDIEEAESAFRGAQPRGLRRVDVQGTQARRFIVPALPGFFAALRCAKLPRSIRDRPRSSDLGVYEACRQRGANGNRHVSRSSGR